VGRLDTPSEQVGEGRLVFVPSAELSTGVHPVRVFSQIDFSGSVRLVGSSAVAMGRQASVVDTGVDGADVTVRLDMPVRPDQRARLLLDELDSPVEPPRSYRFDAPFPLPEPRDPNSLAFETANVAAGGYVLRVEIDGVASVVDDDLRGPRVDF
jgi:hypothetical protein